MNIADLRSAADRITRFAIAAVNPAALISAAVTRQGDLLRVGADEIALNDYDRILVVGAGKASAVMAEALEELIGDRISTGAIIVKDGHAQPLEHIEVFEASHPVPDERGVQATRRIISLLERAAGPKTLVFLLISGGGSALMPLPREGVTLADKQETTRQLLHCGATIDEINTVRKHISRVKGGQLAQVAAPSRMISLLLSDVVGDSLDIIASGPGVGDRSTFSDVRDILENYRIWNRVPKSVRTIIESGLRGEIAETPKPESDIFRNVSNLIIGSNRTAINAASAEAERLGFRPLILSTCMTGEAREVGTVLASISLEVELSQNPAPAPLCLLAGGETTVTIRGNGKGGRNQELALSAALKLVSGSAIVLASIGTDGTDGPTDAAGAIVDTTTVTRARQQGLDPLECLARNDSYNLLQRIGDLYITGPTGTNVMDLMMALIG